MMKLKVLIPSAIGVLLVAAAMLYAYGFSQISQRKLDNGLLKACRFDNAAAASYWLAKGADHDARDKTMHRTPLHECAHFSGVRGTQELLLLAGADVNAIDEFGRTPVFYANFADVAEIFLKYGADLSVRDKDGLTALESRKKNGWHLPDDLKLVLEGKSQAE